MNFEGHLKNVFQMIRDESLVLLLCGLILQMLIPLSFGILTGPLMGTYLLMMVCFLRDNKRPSMNDLFSGLQRFSLLFPVFFLMLLIMAGFFLFIIPGIIFSTWWLYTLVLMADKDMTLGEAMRMSKAKVDEKGFFMHLVFLFMITMVPSLLLNIVAAVIPLLGLLQVLLLPLQCGCVASLYLEQFEGIDPDTLEFGSIITIPPPPPSTPDSGVSFIGRTTSYPLV